MLSEEIDGEQKNLSGGKSRTLSVINVPKTLFRLSLRADKCTSRWRNMAANLFIDSTQPAECSPCLSVSENGREDGRLSSSPGTDAEGL